MMPAPDRLSVLVVDDDEVLVQTLGDILTLNGYHPVGAHNGHEGLSAVGASLVPVPVAIVDLRLPDMDGIALADALRELSDRTQVIILTGNASVDSAVEAMRHGSQDYLVKPVDPDQLLRTVGSASERFRRLRTEDTLRRTQERHGILLESLSELILVLAADGAIGFASPAAHTLLGRDPDAWVGRNLLEAVHPDDRATLRDKLADRVARGGISEAVTFRVQHADGRWRTVEAVAANRLDSPNVAGLVVTVRDVTEKHALESQLADARRLDSIGRLAGGVAHDFNNLLTVMLASVALIEQDLPPDGPVHGELREIRRAAESAARLTRQLLAFGRRQLLEPVILDLNALMGELGELVGHVLPEDVTLRVALWEGNTPVRADPAQLEQVVMNLVGNARDAMPDGGRIVIETAVVSLDDEYVSEHPGAKPGPHVVLSVTDTGQGMDEETRLRLFEPFFTTKEEHQGTGLGLATVHGIVLQSGGNLWVYSEPGLGTTFKVYLPLADGTHVVRPKAGPPATVGGSEQILVVEDNDPVRRLIRVMLGRAGYTVADTDQPLEAVRLVLEQGLRPALLVTDVILPDMRGRRLADTLRSALPTLPVLFISGFAHGAIDFHDAPVAPEHFLPKPFTAEELLQRVRRTLDEARA